MEMSAEGETGVAVGSGDAATMTTSDQANDGEAHDRDLESMTESGGIGIIVKTVHAHAPERGVTGIDLEVETRPGTRIDTENEEVMMSGQGAETAKEITTRGPGAETGRVRIPGTRNEGIDLTSAREAEITNGTAVAVVPGHHMQNGRNPLNRQMRPESSRPMPGE